MTGTQKSIAVAGLVLLLVSTCFAPYDYEARDTIAELTGTSRGPEKGVTYGSIWKAPDEGDVAFRIYQRDTTQHLRNVDLVGLDSGKLGLWWALIASVTIVAVVLAAPSRQPTSPQERPMGG